MDRVYLKNKALTAKQAQLLRWLWEDMEDAIHYKYGTEECKKAIDAYWDAVRKVETLSN